jgi:hypothetical protein
MTRLCFSTLSHAGALTVALLGPASASASAPASADALQWTFGGFGTVGLAHADTEHADFTSSPLKYDGAGFTRSFSAHVDSRLAAQLGVTVNRRWSAVLQLVTEQNIEGSYKPVVEWANIKYQATPDLALRFGRIALPIFLAADYRKLGFAYPWVRMPVEVYGSFAINNSDGVDLSYRWRSGPVKHVTQAFYGHTNVKLFEQTRAIGRSVAGISHNAEIGALNLRASVISARITFNYARPLFDLMRQFGPQGDALAERFDVDDKRATSLALGANYDPGNWFLMGEVAQASTDGSYFGKTRSMYVGAGYRLGSWTAYLSAARGRARSATSDPGLSLQYLPPQLAALAGGLNAGLNGLLMTVPQQSSASVGVRWDVAPNLALKLQHERVNLHNGSRGMLINTQPGFDPDQPVKVTSAVLDFVF